jgi:hypothetical protein
MEKEGKIVIQNGRRIKKYDGNMRGRRMSGVREN